MNPLFVPGELGEGCDVILGGGSPVANSQVGAQPFLQACQTVQNAGSTGRRSNCCRFARLFVLPSRIDGSMRGLSAVDDEHAAVGVGGQR